MKAPAALAHQVAMTISLLLTALLAPAPAGELTLLDVGTPFLWDSADVLEFDMDPFLVMIPAVFRSLVKRDMSKVVDRWRERRRVAIDVVANLYRERLDGWVDPMIVALNRTIEPDEHTVHTLRREQPRVGEPQSRRRARHQCPRTVFRKINHAKASNHIIVGNSTIPSCRP